MRWVKHQKIRIKDGSIDLAADINAAVAVNTGTGEQVTHASAHSEAGVHQGSRRPRQREATRGDSQTDRQPGEEQV